MKNFKGYTTNGSFSVGCTGQTVYLYDKDGNEIRKFKDIIYAYTPMISPDGKIFVVKSTDGRLAVYSLKTFSLVKKFRFSKVNGAQDDGFCFSKNGEYFINLERHIDDLHSVITTYNTCDFSIKSKLVLPDDMQVQFIERDDKGDKYYVLGFVLGQKREYDNRYFVAEFKNNNLSNITKITQKEYEYYWHYKRFEIMGFPESSFYITELGCTLEQIKVRKHSLAKLYKHYNSGE